MAGLAIGTFQILGTLGAGAHSSILHVRRGIDSAQYALKIVNIKGAEEYKYVEQARHEFRVSQMVNHPNLIKIYALEIKRDWLFRVRKVHLLIEYVNGKTLDAIPRLSLPKLVQIFAKIAAGLKHMHIRGIYHADIKPNNVLLSRSGDVKIIDYGLSWIRGEDKGRLQGTPEYMAPEQARRGIVNEQTDIYNFGATMYRLVTFRLPPAVSSSGSRTLDAQTFEANLRPVADCTPQAPRALCDLIHHCLAYDPKHRVEHIGDIQETLDKLVSKLVKGPLDSLEALEW